MDRSRNGNFRFLTPTKQTALVVMSLGLLACAQPPAGAQHPEDKSTHGSLSIEELWSEQDRVAALVDQAAIDAADPAGDEDEAPEPAPLPQGPLLDATALETDIVHLATQLKGSAQTQPEFVSQVLGVALASDGEGRRRGAQGNLSSGTYEIAVWTLYPNAPGSHVSVRVNPLPIRSCALDFARVAGQLNKAGYEGQKLPRSIGPSISFSKDLGSETAFVRLDVDSHDVPQCIWHVAFDLEAKDV